MFFVLVICYLIFSINLSLQAKIGGKDDRLTLKSEAKNSKQPDDSPNETNLADKFIKKSELEELIILKQYYIVKNTIEDFEIEWALHFKPVKSEINLRDSPFLQNIEIRRQRWEYMFTKMNQSYIIKRLDFHLQQANMSRATFCKDIAKAYFELSRKASIFNKNSDDAGVHSNVVDPLQCKSVHALMNTISSLNISPNDGEEMVQLPKSLYVNLIRKDGHAELLKHRVEKKADMSTYRNDFASFEW